jgi:hypothetical protein
MSLSVGFAMVALVASVILLRFKRRYLPIIAVVASGIEVAIAFGLVKLSIAGLPLMLILGAVLTAMGVIIFMKVNTKLMLAASTILTFIGVIQLLVALGAVGGL